MQQANEPRLQAKSCKHNITIHMNTTNSQKKKTKVKGHTEEMLIEAHLV